MARRRIFCRFEITTGKSRYALAAAHSGVFIESAVVGERLDSKPETFVYSKKRLTGWLIKNLNARVQPIPISRSAIRRPRCRRRQLLSNASGLNGVACHEWLAGLLMHY